MRTLRTHGVRCLPAVVALAAGLLGPGVAAPQSRAAAPTTAEMVGQRLVVAMRGTTPSQSLLARIRAGQVGGVILFGSNIHDPSQLRALTGQLQAAARAGGRPPLLIATDQEGGLVRRLPWAPPRATAEQIGMVPASTIESIGHKTGVALRDAGVNLDLAPVADVPRRPDNFLLTQHRAFGTDRFTVANATTAFSHGLELGRVLPTLKHFPGLGQAGAASTDDALVRIGATRSQIVHDLLPYEVAFRRKIFPVVMLSTAIYPALSPRTAAWAGLITQRLLRDQLGFTGVTITDSLTAAASVRGMTQGKVAQLSAEAGVDLVLVTGSEASSKGVYNALLAAAQAGAIPLANLQASYTRIVKLKTRL
jgi:beta-N-acetylhexosaminidase